MKIHYPLAHACSVVQIDENTYGHQLPEINWQEIYIIVIWKLLDKVWNDCFINVSFVEYNCAHVHPYVFSHLGRLFVIVTWIGVSLLPYNVHSENLHLTYDE